MEHPFGVVGLSAPVRQIVHPRSTGVAACTSACTGMRDGRRRNVPKTIDTITRFQGEIIGGLLTFLLACAGFYMDGQNTLNLAAGIDLDRVLAIESNRGRFGAPF